MLYILEYTPKYKIYRCRIKHKYFCSVCLSEAVFTCSKLKTNSAHIHLFMRICLWPMSFTRVGGPTIKKISTLSFSKFSLLTSQPPFSLFMFPYGWAHFQLHRLGLLVVTALLVLLWRFAVSWWSALTRAYSGWRAGWSDHKAAEQNEDYHHELLFEMWSTSLSTGRETKWREAITRSFIVRVYILWFINVFKRGAPPFMLTHTRSLPKLHVLLMIIAMV